MCNDFGISIGSDSGCIYLQIATLMENRLPLL